MWNRSKVEGEAQGDRLQGCCGDTLALTGCPLLRCGQIKDIGIVQFNRAV